MPVTGISFIHSHPEGSKEQKENNKVGIINEFSNGDRAVGMLPGVTNMYRVNGDDKDIWRYNEVEEQMYKDNEENLQSSRGYLYNGQPVYKGILVE